MASLSTARSVPIAKLQPGLESSADLIVTGVVTLFWPYSCSAQTFSFLLVEPDFRLRRQHGQVHIHFSHASAKAVAKARPGSGDTIELGLKGVSWQKPTESTISTPGRGVDWELHFRNSVSLSVWASTA